jgi:hypothetical protein
VESNFKQCLKRVAGIKSFPYEPNNTCFGHFYNIRSLIIYLEKEGHEINQFSWNDPAPPMSGADVGSEGGMVSEARNSDSDTETGGKRCMCDVCWKQFVDNSSLVKRLQTDKHYHCALCVTIS